MAALGPTVAFLVAMSAPAKDLAQEALTRACRHWGTLAAMDYPGVWLHRVAVNLARSHNRREEGRRRAVVALTEAQSTLVDPTMEMALRDAVRNLPERERVAVILRFFADLSVRDTAAVMDTSESTVKFLTHSAVKRLRATSLFNIEEVADA
jgi:RNA polymerase sigma-70 factor (ECF subfamily)